MTESVVDYYSETAIDYLTWSQGYNMHFGYWRWGLNPFCRESMLEEMNLQVASVFTSVKGLVLDLGCGMGATMRSMAHRCPDKRILGFTIVPEQQKTASRLNLEFGTRLRVERASYIQLPLEDGFADGAYALESACYAPGQNKEQFARELHRVLKPGAPFCVADGFAKTSPSSQPSLFRKLLEWSGEGWAVQQYGNLPAFIQALKETGFREVKVREVSWNVGPTALQSPFVVMKYLWRKLKQGEKLSSIQWRHLRACLVAPLVGLFFPHFGYFVITGYR